MIYLRKEKIKSDHLETLKYRQSIEGNQPKSKTRSSSVAAPKHNPLCSLSPWKDIDLLSLASAAVHCNANLTALMYLEIWHEQNKGQVSLVLNESYENEPNDSRFLDLLENSFRGINDPDAIYALGDIGTTSSPYGLVRVYEHEGHYSKAMCVYDTILQHKLRERQLRKTASGGGGGYSSSGNHGATLDERGHCLRGLLSSLQSTGQYYLLDHVI